MSSFYVSSLASAMRYAAPQMAKNGGSEPDFLGYVQASLRDLGVSTGMADGIKSVGARGDGRDEAAQAASPSPAPVAKNQAGAGLFA